MKPSILIPVSALSLLLAHIPVVFGQVPPASATRVSPSVATPFSVRLPIPPIKKPLTSYTDPKTGQEIDYYDLKLVPFQKKFFPDIPGPGASLVGYDGMEPGPTFMIHKGRESVVRLVNENTGPGGNGRPTVMHLHGSYSRAPFDGWARDFIQPGEYKDYYYPEKQSARTLWYHDHALRLTAANMYGGMYGMHIICDEEQEKKLDLPRSGSEFDVPLILNSRFFTPTGNITDISAQRVSVYGDTFMVNGAIMPFLDVQPRRYKFRILNAATSRSFQLKLSADGKEVPFMVVGSDAGIMQRVVATNDLYLGMSERYEVIIDFEHYAGKYLTLTSESIFADTMYVNGTAEASTLMRFVVGKGPVKDHTGNRKFKHHDPLVNLDLERPQGLDRPVDQTFVFSVIPGVAWTINGRVFDDTENRVLRNVPRGTTEKWLLTNPSNATWSHPIHLHLVDFQVVSRTATDPNLPSKRPTGVAEYESEGLKDVVILAENESVEVVARYAPWDGVYMFHCHNLIHEDHDMMAAFNITSLKDFGYPDTTILTDPLDPRFAAKPYPGSSDVAQIQAEVLPFYSSLDAYEDPMKVIEKLDAYWQTKTGTAPQSTPSSGGGGGNRRRRRI